MKLFRYSLFFIILSIDIESTEAQIKLIGINHFEQNQEDKNSRFRKNNEKLHLPFWDDFSFSTGFVPLEKHWQESNSVYVGNGLGKNPPSFGVATLDGINEFGEPYDGIEEISKTDALTSQPVDLSSHNVFDNVCLSFFYQHGGYGERPEEKDYITLEFLLQLEDGSLEWKTVWPDEPSLLDRSGEFIQHVQKLDEETFFHESFQFRVQNHGKSSGFFDLWNLDYFYMNSGRSTDDIAYPDRTIASTLSSIFKGMYSIPAKHFKISQLKDPTYVVSSMDSIFNEPEPYFNYYQASTISWNDGIQKIHNIPKINRSTESIKAPNRNLETHLGLTSQLSIPTDFDSAFVEITTMIDADDNELPPQGEYDLRFSPIDFTNNDKIVSTFILKDYYAYDDGTAEAGVEMSFANNMLAIQFPVTPEIQDELSAVDLYFPLADSDPEGQLIDITIWSHDNKKPGVVLYNEIFRIERGIIPNQYKRYKFTKPVVLADTFFLGYVQKNEKGLAIGYDLSNNTKTFGFVNFYGDWLPIESEEFVGSFMIRPVFGAINNEVITSKTHLDYNQTKSDVIFNSPTNTLFIDGGSGTVKILNVLGELIFAKELNYQKEEFDLSGYPKGLYFVNISSSNKLFTQKIFLK